MIPQSIEILIPAYNEEKNIEIVIKKCLSWLKNQTKDFGILIVDDGSTDNTGKILDSLAEKDKHLKVIHNRKNLGNGETLKIAYENSTKDIILSCPADQQFDPADFSRVLPYVNQSDIICVYRSKKPDYNLFRSFISNMHRLVLRIFFNLNIKDINWVKMYKKWTLKELDLKSKSVLINTEILAKAKKRNARIMEISAPYYNRIYGESKGTTLKHLWQVSLELIKLYWTVKIFK